jgi:hypothetical protein
MDNARFYKSSYKNGSRFGKELHKINSVALVIRWVMIGKLCFGMMCGL